MGQTRSLCGLHGGLALSSGRSLHASMDDFILIQGTAMGRTCGGEDGPPGQVQDAPEAPRHLEVQVIDLLPLCDIYHHVAPAHCAIRVSVAATRSQ